MAQVISQEQLYSSEATKPATWTSYLPAILAIAGALGMLLLRLQIGQSFISDGALMMISLACYILGALFLLTNLYAPSEMNDWPTWSRSSSIPSEPAIARIAGK